MRFHRAYELRVLVPGRELRVTSPFRIQFEATKSIAGLGLNKLTARLWGLSEKNREFFVKDAEERKFLRLELHAGYRGDIKKIFTGDLHRGSNILSKDGFETRFECFDGGFDYLNSFTSRTVVGKTNAINALLEDMPNTQRGIITEFDDLVRPKVLYGSSSKLVEDLLGPDETFYIEDGRMNIIKDSEVVTSYIPAVNARTGLVNTPEREFSKVTFDTLINPSIAVGGRVFLESGVAAHLNGVYRIDSITYKGDYEGAEWTQTITGFLDRNSRVLR